MPRLPLKSKAARIPEGHTVVSSLPRGSTQEASVTESITRSPSLDASLFSPTTAPTSNSSVSLSSPTTPSTPQVSLNEGVNQTPAVQEGERVLVEVHKNKTFDGLTREVLVSTIHSHFEGPYIRWSNVADETLMLWWKLFQMKCTWDTRRYTEDTVFKAFCHEGSNHFRRTMNKARTNKRQPRWIKQSIWEEMLAIWASEDFKKKSEQNMKNRAMLDTKGVPIYRGGSVSTTVHKQRMANENKGEKPSPTVVYKTLFKKNGDEYTEKFDRLVEQKTKEAEEGEGPVVIDEDQLWIEATSGVKKGRVYCMGSEAPSILKKTRYVRSAASLGASGQSEASGNLHNDTISALSIMNTQFTVFAEKMTAGQAQIREELAALGETVEFNKAMEKEESATMKLYVDKTVDSVVHQAKDMTEKMQKDLQDMLITTVQTYFSKSS